MNKQTTKPVKTVTAQALSNAFKSASEQLVVGIQEFINCKASMEQSVNAMRKTKVVFGKSRATCAMLQYVYDQLDTLKTAKGYKLTKGTKDNYLNAIKTAVRTGNELNLNLSRKAKPAGQSQTPKTKDKEQLIDDDVMATTDDKPSIPKVGAYKSNDDAIAAIVASIKTVKTQCTIAQWKAISTLYPSIATMID